MPGFGADGTAAASLVYGTTYFIVLSEIDPGMQPALTIN